MSEVSHFVHRFTGQERDTETGLDFFQARYHGSAQGRFLSSDPLGNLVADPTSPQSWNQFSYVSNSPLVYTDPSGYEPGQCYYTVTTWGEGDNATSSTNLIGCEPGGNGEQQPVYVFSTTVTKPAAKTESERWACAADFGQSHSIAAAFGKQNTFVGNLLGGNTMSGIIGLGQIAFGSRAPDVNTVGAGLLNGVRQGIPGSGPSSGLTGPLNYKFAKAASSASYKFAVGAYNTARGSAQVALSLPGSAAEEAAIAADVVAPLAAETLSNVAFGVGVAKFLFDLSTVGYGYLAACK